MSVPLAIGQFILGLALGIYFAKKLAAGVAWRSNASSDARQAAPEGESYQVS